VHRLIFILSFIFLNVLSAQTIQKDSITVVFDDGPIIEKGFSEDFSQKYSSEDFNYNENDEEAQNLLGRAVSWFFQQLEKLFGVDISPPVLDVVEFLVYLLLTIFIGYFIIKLLLGQNTSSFFNRKTATVNPLTIDEEHIEHLNLDTFIDDALAQKNYRLAIRYMYLKALKELSSNNIISWHFEKTNNDYYNEIKDPLLKDNFKKVSYLYDYVWYGEFDLDEIGFTNAQKDFERLTKNIDNAG
jgi:hypothetical protein|tara:strand:- start:3626 stop:4354 length:729 start_codon:yes stop_codon:yes gene_type:complete